MILRRQPHMKRGPQSYTLWPGTRIPKGFVAAGPWMMLRSCWLRRYSHQIDGPLQWKPQNFERPSFLSVSRSQYPISQQVSECKLYKVTECEGEGARSNILHTCMQQSFVPVGAGFLDSWHCKYIRGCASASFLILFNFLCSNIVG